MIDALWGITRFAAVLGAFWLLVTFGPTVVTDFHSEASPVTWMIAFFAAFAFAVTGGSQRA